MSDVDQRLAAIKDITHRLCKNGMPRDSTIHELCVEAAAFIANMERQCAELRAENEALRKEEFRQAVIDQLVVCFIYGPEHDTNARKAIKDLLRWHVMLALDPSVSEDAQALIDKGRQEALLILMKRTAGEEPTL